MTSDRFQIDQCIHNNTVGSVVLDGRTRSVLFPVKALVMSATIPRQLTRLYLLLISGAYFLSISPVHAFTLITFDVDGTLVRGSGEVRTCIDKGPTTAEVQSMAQN